MNIEIRKEVKEGTFKCLRGYRKIKVIGWVVGCIYPPDGCEWLYRGSNLCALNDQSPNSNPTFYKNKDKALAFAQTLTSDWPLFIRPYIYSSFQDNP